MTVIGAFLPEFENAKKHIGNSVPMCFKQLVSNKY